jgi:periplasmic divalent cation tolerance protein
MTDSAALVYTTFPDEQTAESAARRLVESRLAACVNIVPRVVSVYAWKGKVERGEEVSLLVKTRSGRVRGVMEALRAIHPYETPSIVSIDVGSADPATLAWLLAETGAVAQDAAADP